MSRLCVFNYSMSLDGYAAGPDQSLEHPMGVGGMALHTWAFAAMKADSGVDAEHIAARTDNVGATIMGRNMFGPVRGAWETDPLGSEWTGWWGEEPPYHHDVFVLTHHDHDPIPMAGGTTFHFVTDGIHSALARATAAAGGADIALGGGASTVQQYLRAGLIDDLHVALAPVLLGAGERLFEDVDQLAERYEVSSMINSAAVTHMHITKRPITSDDPVA